MKRFVQGHKARIEMWLLKLFLLQVDDDYKENPRNIL